MITINYKNNEVIPEEEITIEKFSSLLKTAPVETLKIKIENVLKFIRPLSFCPYPDKFEEPFYINCERIIKCVNNEKLYLEEIKK